MATAPRTPQLAIGPAAASDSEDRSRVLGQVVSNDSQALLKESLSTFLADLVAKLHDLDPTESQFQLYDHVEPDALDALFEHAQSHHRASWRFELEVGEETLVVDSEGYVTLDG